MRFSGTVSVCAVISGLMLQGCAHSSMEKRVADEVAQEDAIRAHADLRAQTARLIETAPGLSPEQRSRLSGLRDSTASKLDSLHLQSLKLRAVLMKHLITETYDGAEIDFLKGKIKDLQNQQLNVTFDAIEQANRILGHDVLNNHRIMWDLWEGHGSLD